MRSEAGRVVSASAALFERGFLRAAARPQRQWVCLSCRSRQQREVRSFSFTTSIRTKQDNTQPQTPASTSTLLPSHTAKQRSDLSKRLAKLTDSILARASIAGQHINTYTGTDFSGIEALRKEIGEQEEAVRTQHVAVGEAKDRHTEARAKQASSQKEIVGLLERKSSWSPSDLERYMLLVRSEHVDEQAVQKAAEDLGVAERKLEDTRSLLEKLERKQYHEEQIWSDTIRRNSTWVTIGLMGVNILLLLAQISIFEPYRRRKIVKQIKEALDERTPVVSQLDTIMGVIDGATEPEGVSLEQLESAAVTDNVTPESSSPGTAVEMTDVASSSNAHPPPLTDASIQAYVAYAKTAVKALLSEQPVQLKQIDVTTIALEGAAAGMAIAGMISLLILRATY